MQDRVDRLNHSDGRTPERSYDELPLLLLVAKLDSALTELEHAKLAVEEIRGAQQRRVQEAVDDARHLLGKSEGTVTVKLEGCEVKATKPKKVSWSQGKLIAAARMIKSRELGDPDAFIRAEYTINERVYETLLPKIKTLLADARTLTHGTEKIEVTPEEVPF